ncbi:MAG: phenazine biosynthesis protein PhzF family [Solirubrobacterales bacterium]|nr:phenazine biosynthesis protein PhzF family [Solirubrobacterales bacterium]
MSAHRYAVVDVFTDVPLQGNQLAVFTDATALAGEILQPLARELNLSETVYVLAPEQDADARVRIFTPTAELPFAGHPVLGTAIVLGIERGLEHVALETGAGIVPVALGHAGGGADARTGSGSMVQPVPTWQPFERAPELLAALGVESSGLPVEIYVNGPRHVYVELESEDAVAALSPDLRALAALGELGVSCFAGAGARWKSRMFAPALGVPEDPATGSAAGPLALHLARHGRIAFGEEIEIRQGVELARPSLLRARATGSADAVERVEVAGSAVIVAGGEFVVG